MELKLTLLATALAMPLASCGTQDSGNAATTRSYEAANSLGRWCAKPSTLAQTWQLIELVDGPNPVTNIVFGDGSKRVRALTRTDARTFKVTDDSRGERYELNQSSDGLSEYDNDGMIFIAERLKPTDSPEVCLDK